MKPASAAAVIIGNEVLTAKVRDLNGAHLIGRLRERGVALRWMAIVPDEIDAIVEAVAHGRSVATYVFTSGGIGPTHDDVTVRAVALVLGRAVVRIPELEALIRRHSTGPVSPEALRLAEAPAGTELLWREGTWYPVLHCDGVYLLPGVPQLFKVQLEAVLPRLEGTPMRVRSLYLCLGEPEIAGVLDRVAISAPDVAIGSYPEFDRDAGYRVKVTVENPELESVDAVVAKLRAELPEGAILRVE